MSLVVFAICVSFLAGVLGKCPSQDIIGTCQCDNNRLSCSGTNITEDAFERVVVSLTEQLTNEEKHFTGITLRSTELIQLKENVFKGLTFGSIELFMNSKLKRIHRNAFEANNFKTQNISFVGNSALDQSATELFEILGQMVSLESIYFDYSHNMTEIPSYAFKPLNGYKSNLKTISFWRTPISKIATRAFYYLNSLTSILFFQNDLTKLDQFAFEFEQNSSEVLDLSFWRNYKLRPESFQINCLTSMRRPTYFTLNYQSPTDFPYLDEKVFLPFLLADSNNQFEYMYIKLDCSDCRNVWLRKHDKLIKKQFQWYCNPPSISFDDPNNFSQCKE